MWRCGTQAKEQVYRLLRELRDHLVATTGRVAEISGNEIVIIMSPVPCTGSSPSTSCVS